VYANLPNSFPFLLQSNSNHFLDFGFWTLDFGLSIHMKSAWIVKIDQMFYGLDPAVCILLTC